MKIFGGNFDVMLPLIFKLNRGVVVNKKLMLSLVSSVLFMGEAVAIEPVFEGENGIKAKVFATNCTGCHSSTLSGSARQNAPDGINFDTFSTAVTSGKAAVNRAVTQNNMPPTASSFAALTDEQKLALSNWEALGFPEHMLPAIFSTSSTELTLPKIYVKDAKGAISSKVSATLILKNGQPPFSFEVTKLGEVMAHKMDGGMNNEPSGTPSETTDENGCVLPKTWHAEMNHCMVQ